MQEIVRVENLCKSFRLSSKQRRLEHTKDKIRTAVDHLTFSMNAGEIFGLLGPNGAGKTTTLRLLATLLRPDSGDALIDGSSILSDPAAVRAKIGFLTSELRLDPVFTPNDLFSFFAALHGVPEEICEERRRAIFDRFGMQSFAEVKVADLSTGMKQKVSLAVSLVHDPDIIIFDEPTNGLDVLTARTVTEYLLSLKEQGKTMLVSTHIFSLIEKLCDRVGILIEGKLVRCGTLAEITDGMTLEDRFFEIYRETVGDVL